MDCSTPGSPVLHCLPEFAQIHSIESVMPSNNLVLCRCLLLFSSIFPSIRDFLIESALPIRCPKYYSFKIIVKWYKCRLLKCFKIFYCMLERKIFYPQPLTSLFHFRTLVIQLCLWTFKIFFIFNKNAWNFTFPKRLINILTSLVSHIYCH